MAHMSKSREAGELRVRAEAVIADLKNPAIELTAEQVEAKEKEYRALVQRANLLDEITPEKEIERRAEQGDQDFRALKHAMQPTEEDEVEFRTVEQQMEQFRDKVKKAFGGIGAYARAATGMRRDLTPKQVAVLKEAAKFSRTIIGTAADASGGEYLLPLQQDDSLFRVDNAQDGILQRGRRFTVRGRTLRIPHVVQTDGDLTRPLSSISNVQIIGEASSKDIREPVIGQRTLTVFKYAAITQVGDETLEDDLTGELQSALVQMVGGEILNQMNYDMTINGGGTTNSVGALHTSANAALIKVTRQTQNRIKYQDAINMWVRHTHGPRSFWMVSRRAFAELPQFELSTGSSAVWSANFMSNPNQTLLGYPVVVCDFLNTLGSESDFALVNPDFYAVGLRKALTVESSIHYAFRDDVTTWRFVARGGGIPIPDGTYAYRSAASTKVDEHSPFVTLDDVYV